MSSPADESMRPPPPPSAGGAGDSDVPISDGGTSLDVGGDGSADSAPSLSHPQSLHDLLSLGEIESALSSSKFSHEKSPSTGTIIPLKGKSGDDLLGARLPLLLRWLSVAQPLVTTSEPSLDKNTTAPSNESTLDPNAIVPLLEDVAAAHPSAENVEVLVSALAPSICKDAFGGHQSLLSRNKMGIPFLQRQMMMAGVASSSSSLVECNGTTWDTTNLDKALTQNPSTANISHSHKRKKEASSGDTDVVAGKKRQKAEKSDPLLEKMKMVIDILEQDDNDDGDEEINKQDGDDPSSQTIQNEEAPSSFFAQASSAANDSHESSMRRVLQELISLVKSSLPTRHSDGSSNGSNDDGGGVGTEGGEEGEAGRPSTSSSSSGNKSSSIFFQSTGFLTPALALKTDSLFAETHEVSSSLGGGWSRLSVMIPTLMQHAPILRHEHVANALCRASVPQAPSLIKDMAANCPAATQSLLRGCVTAYQLAEKYEFVSSSNNAATTPEDVDVQHESDDSSMVKDILRTSVEATQCLASLSRREALNAIRILKEQRVMDGLVLSLLIELDDLIGAASFIVEKLSLRRMAMSPTSNENSIRGTFDTKHRRRKMSLRQRMMNSQTIGIAQPTALKASGPTETVSTQLSKELAQDKALAENVRRFISQRIIHLLKMEQNRENISLGEVTLFVQAYALLVHSTGIGAGSSAGSGSKFVEDIMAAIGQLLSEGECSYLPTRSSKDNIHKTAMCATLVTCCKYPPIGDAEGSVMVGPAVKACLDRFRQLLIHPESIEGVIFSSRIAGFIIDSDAASLREVNLDNIFSRSLSNGSMKEENSQMKNVCRWLSSKIEMETLTSVYKKGMSFDSLIHDPIVAVEAMRRCNSRTSNDLDDLMKDMFADPKFCAKIIQHPRACDLVQESVKMLVKGPTPHIPLVLPLSLERLAQSLAWGTIDTNTESTTCELLPQFVLQIVYALDFLDSQPLSPFVVNPRSFPLDKLLAFLESRHKKSKDRKVSGFGALRVTLKELVSKHCPDIIFAVESRINLEEHDELYVSRSHIVKPMMVSDAIRDCLKGDRSLDPSGLRAERMFMLCRSKYPSLDVDVAAVGAILAADNSQPKFYSYVALSKDPLILLKARAAVWKCKGVRSILLCILEHLMSANECIAMQGSSATESVVLEYLAARDTIIVRCIVFACAPGFAFKGSEAGGTSLARHCMLSVCMIRSIISKRRGIIAALIKQDLPENWIDWIVEYVPESLADAPIIISILSEKGLLTATERLTAASAGLKIAIAHSPRGEASAKNLMMASTAALLDSFILVVGPVGVPVSVLREENGQDVTNVCRKAMFHMLKTLSIISPKNEDLKNEASITISKIAALCKSENAVGGVSGVAASRRKALLKEIWEKCLQVNTALGGAMQI